MILCIIDSIINLMIGTCPSTITCIFLCNMEVQGTLWIWPISTNVTLVFSGSKFSHEQVINFRKKHETKLSWRWMPLLIWVFVTSPNLLFAVKFCPYLSLTSPIQTAMKWVFSGCIRCRPYQMGIFEMFGQSIAWNDCTTVLEGTHNIYNQSGLQLAFQDNEVISGRFTLHLTQGGSLLKDEFWVQQGQTCSTFHILSAKRLMLTNSLLVKKSSLCKSEVGSVLLSCSK